MGLSEGESGLTTPHKLQAEARSRKRARRRLVVCPLSKPMAEACQLHAVVRHHPSRSAPLGRWARHSRKGGRLLHLSQHSLSKVDAFLKLSHLLLKNRNLVSEVLVTS